LEFAFSSLAAASDE
jgi:hypothetical protein